MASNADAIAIAPTGGAEADLDVCLTLRVGSRGDRWLVKVAEPASPQRRLGL
jgi:hypothetical protein